MAENGDPLAFARPRRLALVGDLSWSLTDQFVIAGANFVVQLMIARWLGAGAYGSFAVGYAIMLLLAAVHAALVLDPLSVLGARGDRHRESLTALHLGCAAALIAVAIAIAVVAPLPGLGAWAAAAALPLVATQALARRRAYVAGAPAGAAAQAVVYAAVLIAGIAGARAQGVLSPAMALVTFGLAAGVAAGGGLLAGGARVPRVRPDRDALAEAMRAHWRFGRWGAGEALLLAGGALAYPVLVAALAGLAEAGTFRAAQNLFLPLGHAATALSLLMLPRLSRRAHQGHAAWAAASGRMIGATAAAAATYVVAVAGVAGPLARLVYGGGYPDLTPLVGPIALAALFAALAAALATALRAAERPADALAGQGARAATTFALGPPLAAGLGVVGLAAALLASAAAASALLGWRFRRYARRGPDMKGP